MPTNVQFAETAWQIQTGVNQWFQMNGQPWPITNLTPLAHQEKPLHSDPDGNWYTKEGTPPKRPSHVSLRNQSFWRAAEPLFDFLHEHYRVAWTYTLLMLQPSKQFRGTRFNLGLGDHFTAQEQVIFERSGSRKVRTGWHANQFPPFLVQQKLHEVAPFELISTYQLNILQLKDALPLIITRSPNAHEMENKSRVISVSRFDEVFGETLEEFLALVEGMGAFYGSSGWASEETEKLKASFTEIDEQAMKVLNREGGDLFNILNAGADPNSEARKLLEFGLRRPGKTNLALAKYLILMTAVWPDWTRIIMIPHRVPVFADPQPGGIVICEDTQSEKISAGELEQIGDLLSTSIWPWVSLQSGKRSENDTALKIVERMCAAILHEHNWAFIPVDDLLADEKSWKSMTRAKADPIKAGIKITALSLTALCGLADKPEEKTEYLAAMVQELGKQFARLGCRFNNRRFEVSIPQQFNPAIPRLFNTILIEVIRNAFKHSGKTTSHLPVTLTVASAPDTDQFTIIIRNPAPTDEVKSAVERYTQMREEFDRTDHVLASTDSVRKGIPLVMILVEFARAIVEYRAERDGLQSYLAVEIHIRTVGGHHA